MKAIKLEARDGHGRHAGGPFLSSWDKVSSELAKYIDECCTPGNGWAGAGQPGLDINSIQVVATQEVFPSDIVDAANRLKELRGRECVELWNDLQQHGLDFVARVHHIVGRHIGKQMVEIMPDDVKAQLPQLVELVKSQP